MRPLRRFFVGAAKKEEEGEVSSRKNPALCSCLFSLFSCQAICSKKQEAISKPTTSEAEALLSDGGVPQLHVVLDDPTIFLDLVVVNVRRLVLA